MNDDEYDAWCQSERERLVEYLAGQGVPHGRVAEWPAFDVPPYLAVWAVESGQVHEAIGWWAFTGDIPTDYVTADQADVHPRRGLQDLVAQWERYLHAMKTGGDSCGMSIGDDSAELQELLTSRVQAFRAWVEDDDVWQEDT